MHAHNRQYFRNILRLRAEKVDIFAISKKPRRIFFGLFKRLLDFRRERFPNDRAGVADIRGFRQNLLFRHTVFRPALAVVVEILQNRHHAVNGARKPCFIRRSVFEFVPERE